MKHIIRLLLLLTISFNTYAQDGQQFGKIRALRVAYLTNKLNLNSSQSAQFWPIYNKYSEERRELRAAYRKNYKGNQARNMDKVEAYQYVENNIEYQEKELALKKKYKDELLRVISPQQLATLYQAERDFKAILIKKLQERRQ
jgi:hypothetical protein